ncbi:unnamed protein product [Brassica rapa]|uniref:Uncharacterized protein n=1 Tax=Brassica campestris TaxID=3711 RepID=A0A8D9I2I8_BRACM|nr:unnamed protein product [Brassica rapa]
MCPFDDILMVSEIDQRSTPPLHARSEGNEIEDQLGIHNGFNNDEASNRSSSGSVVSNSESCDQSNAWETTFPCKKRTCAGRRSPKAGSTSDNNRLVTIERPCESLNQNLSETRVVMKSPEEVIKIRSKHTGTGETVENSVSSHNKPYELRWTYGV